MTAKELAHEFFLGIRTAMTCPDVSVAEYEGVIASKVQDAIEAAVKEEKERTIKDEAVRFNDLVEDYDKLLGIARELAAKCVRGSNACTACGACAYLGALEHNAGCLVKQLEAYS